MRKFIELGTACQVGSVSHLSKSSRSFCYQFPPASPDAAVVPRGGLKLSMSSRGSSYGRVVAAADCCWLQGPLTAWHRESALLCEYFRNPSDCYDVHVQEVFPAVRPELLTHKLSRHVGSGGLGAISLTHPLFLGGWAGTAGDVLLNRLGPADPAPGSISDENLGLLFLVKSPWEVRAKYLCFTFRSPRTPVWGASRASRPTCYGHPVLVHLRFRR